MSSRASKMIPINHISLLAAVDVNAQATPRTVFVPSFSVTGAMVFDLLLV